MNRNQCACAISLVILSLTVAGCGGGHRLLESISISPNPATAKNGAVQLTATGSFTSSPVTVKPLPVVWTASTCDNLCNTSPPAVLGPVSINQDGLASCPGGFHGSESIYAYAPQDPSLPLNTPNVQQITGSATVICP